MEKFYIDLWNTENDMNGYNNKVGGTNVKKIICIETGEIFKGTQDAIDKMFPGRSRTNIKDHLNGKTKKAFGYHFKYIDE